MPGPLSRTDHAIAPDGSALLATKGLVYVATLTGALTVDNTYPSICKLDPGGAHRDVTLDAEETSEGLYRRFVNAADAAENLVIKDDAAATVATVNQNEEGEFYCTGAAWVLVCIRTIALS